MLRRTTRPALENLEARDVPSVTLQSLNNGHTLRITGTADWENVQIVQDDQTNTLEVSYFLMPKPNQIMELMVYQAHYSSDAITKIQIDLGAGNDSFSYSLADGASAKIARQWTINMGAGDDSVNIDTAKAFDRLSASDDADSDKPGYFWIVEPLTPAVKTEAVATSQSAGNTPPGVKTGGGTAGNQSTADKLIIPFTTGPKTEATLPADYHNPDQALIQYKLGMTIDTGAGNDSVNILLGEVADDAVVRLTTSLGAGNDYYSFLSDDDIGQRSTVLLDVNAGSGNDTVAANFNGTTGEESLVDLIFRGADGNDIMDVGFYGRLDGRFILRLYGGMGHDKLSLTTDTDPKSQGQMNFMIQGNAGHDIMTYQTLGADDVTLVSALIDGGANRNVARISREITCLNCTDIHHLPPLTPWA